MERNYYSKGLNEFNHFNQDLSLEMPSLANELHNNGFIKVDYYEENYRNYWNQKANSIASRKQIMNDIPFEKLFGCYVDIDLMSFGNVKVNSIYSDRFGKMSLDCFIDSYLLFVADEWNREIINELFNRHGIESKIVGENGFIFIKRPNYNTYDILKFL